MRSFGDWRSRDKCVRKYVCYLQPTMGKIANVVIKERVSAMIGFFNAIDRIVFDFLR